MKVVILTVVLAAVLSVDAKPSIGTQRTLCTDESNGTFIADDEYCWSFFVCYNGELVNQRCPPGSYFDETDLYCLPDTNNTCTQQCSVDGQFSAHPSNCNLFYVCYQGELVEQSCGPKSYFDQVNLYCLPDKNNTCPQPNCTVNGAFSPHPTNCSAFYVCYEGELVEQSCGAGSYFNKTNLYCLPDTDNVCPETQCSVDGAFSPHPSNCNLFYVCYEGELVEQSCGAGSYFDKTNLYCLPDTNNTCPVPVCTVEGAFSPHPTECALFYVCYNGLLVEQTCGNGSYFDKDNLYCLPDDENICWPLTPTPTPENCTCVGGYTDGEFVASPDSCYSYYICSAGDLVEQNCGYGNYFDNSTKRCERDTTGECWPTNTTSTSTTSAPCKCPGGYEEGDFVPSSDNCYSYYVCTQGALVEQSCGQGNYFDNSTKTCERDDNGVCWPTTTTPAPCACPGGLEEGDLVGNSDSCHSYFICTQGELVAQSCGTGNYFDVNSKTCERDTNGVCWPTTTTPAPCTCPGGYEEGDLVGNSDSCHSYFICTQGELVAQSCGTGNYFDVNSKTCERDTNGVCWPTTTTPAPCTCPGGLEEGDLVGNSDSCHSYFICTQGELVAQSCGTGNYFDVNSKTCERDTNGVCWPTTTTPAPCTCPGGYEEGDLVGNSDSCHSYFICTQGELVAQSCGTGNYFDGNSKTCERDTNGVCWPTTTTPAPCTCPGGLEEGDLVGNSDSCHSYFICTQGELVAQSCGTGNYFDVNSKTCERDTNGVCWPTTTTPAPCTCPGGYEEGDLVGNSDNCHSYFICTQGELVAQSCGTGNYFDVNSKTCERDTNGVCWPTTTTPAPCTCPGGYEEGDLVGNSDSCHSYFICTQGELVAQSCGIGNYFDDNTKTCVRDNNGVCWPTTSSSTTSSTTTPSTTTPSTTTPSTTTPSTTTPSTTTPSTTTPSTTTPSTTTPSTTTPSTTTPSTTTPSTTTPSTTTPSTTTPSTTTPSTTKPTTEAPCTCTGGYEDGEFIPYPGNCSLFYICYNGDLIEESCKEGNYFDPESKSCVWDTTGECWPLPTTPTTSTTTKITPSPTTPSTTTPSTTTPSTTTRSTTTPSTTTPSTTTPSTTTPSTTTTSTTAAPCECPGGYKDGELIPYPGICYLFYICYNGELVERSCGNGSYFDAESKSCVWDTTGECWPLSTTPTTSTTTTITPSPSTPSTTTPSTTTPSTTTPSTTTRSTTTPSTTTPSTTTPSTTTPSTTTPSTTTPSTTAAPCECPGGYKDGELIPYPGICYLFYICYNGELVERSCGNGSYFDAESKSCVWDTTGECWPLPTTPTTSTTTKITPSPSTPSTTTPSTTTPSTTTPSTTTPSTTTRSTTTPSTTTPSTTTPSTTTPSTTTPSTTTPSTTTPSTTTPSTTTPSTTAAPCECPGGYKDGDFIPYPGSCYLFYICYKGELIEESCKEGNYFDAESKSCVWDTTGECWPLPTTPTTSTTTKITPSPSTPSTTTPSTTTPSTTTPSTTTPSTTTPSTTTPSTTTPSTTTPSTTTPSTTTPSTTTPSTTTPSTTTPSTTTPSTTAAPCECPGGYKDGDFIPYPGSCYLFYICYKGELIEESCKEGNYFDAESKSCVWDTTGECWPLPTTPTTSTTTKITPSPSTPSTTTPSTTTPSTTTPSTTTPSTTTRSTTTPSTTTPSTTTPSTTTPSTTTPSTTTPSTTTPSTTTPSTTTPSTTAAPCECPGGYKDGDFIPYPGSCYLFYICYKGELIKESCKEGNYFDAESKSCVWDTTGECWPLPTTPTTSTTTKITPSPSTPSTTTPSTTTPSTTTPSTTTPSTTTPSTTTPSTTTPSTTTPSTTTPSTTTPSTTTPSTTAAPCECPGGYKDGDFIPYPGSCYLFYICYKGELIEESCKEGNYFDAESKSCVWDTTGECWPLPTTPTTSTTTKITPSPSTPSTTTPSTTTPSTTTPSTTTPSTTTRSTTTPSTTTPSTTTPSTTTPSTTTPSTTTPSTTTPSTTTPSTTTPSTTAAPCECPGGYKDGDFIPYPGSCYLFYICYKGELIKESCKEGNYFDAESKSCVWDTTGECWPLPTTPTTSTTTKITPSPSTPSTTTPSTTTPSTTTPSTTTPSTTTPSTTTPSTTTPSTTTPSTTTPSTTTPSTTTPSTTTPSTTAAPCECPGGYKDGDFIPYPGSCYLFYICYKGELIEESCKEGNYFDAESKSCVLDTTGECWPLPTTPTTSTTTKITPSTPSTTTPSTTTPSTTTPSTTTPSTTTPSTTTPSTTTPSTTTPSTTTPSTTPPSTTTPSTTTPSTTTPSTTTPSTTTPSTTTPSTTTPSTTTPSTTTISTTAAPCECPGGYKDGDFIPYPGTCYMFYICYNGELVERSCGNGSYFDAESKSCVWDTTGECWPLPTTPTTSTTTKITPSPSTPSTTTPSTTTPSTTTPSTTTRSTTPSTTTPSTTTPSTTTPSTTTPSTTTPSTTTPSTTTPSTTTPSTTTPSTTTKTTTVVPCTCPGGYEEGEFVPHPSSCYLFYVCYEGELREVSCGYGNYFDNQTKSCVLDTDKVCWSQSSSSSTTAATTLSTTTAPCTCPGGYENGDFVPHPDTCYLFYVCYQGELSVLSCGVGNYFDNNTKSCAYDTTGICWINSTTPAPETCANGSQEGELSPNPSSCYLYYICSSGELVEGNCGIGNYFNNASKLCEPDANGCCWPVKPTPPAPCDCSNGLKEGQLIANPSSCSSFYICYGGELVENNCGTGNYFNNVSNVCEPDTGGSCWPVKPTPPAPCDCPNGLKEGQLIANPSSCSSFYICYGGELVENNCGTGNYFNNVSNICEPDTGGCCWPVKPTPPAPEPTPCECPNGLKEGEIIANPSACYLYNLCHDGKLVEGHCGTGNYFNNASNLCEPDTGGCCWQVIPTPPTPCDCPNGLKQGEFTENPTACYLYYLCYNGELVEGHCGTGNYFNNATGICEPDLGGCCWPVEPTLPPPPSPTPSPCECSNGAQEGQSTAHPSSCYLFYICHDGELVQQNCGTGNYFNNVTNICEPDTGGCCWPKTTTCSGGYRTGEFIADTDDCDKFYICNDGALVAQECGVGYFFDIDNKYCTRDINGTCWTAEPSGSTCVGAPDGTFLRNDAACDKFFFCYNNTKYIQECGIGNLFNSATLACARDTYGTCWKKIPNVCANQITGTFVPNPNNCQEFYVCLKNRAVLQQCGDANWFNPESMICQPDLKAQCVNVCRGTSNTTNLAHPNCNQFYRCLDGRTDSVENCPTGTNFDATDGICKSSAICEADLCYKSINGAVHPVQNDVTSFYTCYNQMPIKLSCPDGTSFDSDLLVCTPDTGRCIGQKNGHLVPSFNNPNAFYVCRNNMAVFEQCPSYAIFDAKKRICVHAERRRLANSICADEPNGTMLSGNACNTFHICLDGQSIEQNCGAYSSFNQKLSQCVFNLSCYDQNEICIRSSDIEKFPDARYETSFIKCKRGLAVVEKCPKGMIYSHDIGYCVLRDLAMTHDELDEICDNVPDNTLTPALDCRKFYICRNRVAMLQQCAIDQYYDIKTGSCQPDVERQCWLRSETLRRSFHLKTVCHEGQIRADPSDCEQFEICTYGVWTREACPAGQYFDSITKVCNNDSKCLTARSTVECFDDMPLRASEELCTDYYRCVQNQWKIKKCPVGQFFSSKMAACTNDASSCIPGLEMRSTNENRCSSNETRTSNVNCGIYHICYEGEWWYRYCEEGTYFNKSLGTCVSNDGTCILMSKAGPCKNGTVKKSDFDPCINYYLCADGNWTVQHCPVGHHFNESRKACMLDYEDRVCKAEVKNVSSTCVEGSRRHMTSVCTAFEVCSFGRWLSVECHTGFYYDTALEKCIANRGECSTNGLMRRECVDNTSRTNQNNCSQFYYCSRNEWHLESCLEGFQYNATIDKCIPTNSTCAVRNQTNWIPGKCVGIKSGTYISHETDCTKYYLCIDDQDIEANCSYGKFYDKESKLCQLNDGACPLKAQADNTICASKPDGSRVQNPGNCTSFFICSEAQPLLSYCYPGMYFNAELGVCQTDTGICNKPRLCDDNPGGHLPHETYCNIYYACVRGLAIPVACEEDEIFDPTTRKCTADVEHRCLDGILISDEICSKTENGVPLVDSDDCTKYIVCTNGLAQTFQCPQGQFFDSSLMFCMPDNGSCPYVDNPDVPNNSSIPPDPISCIGKHGDLMPDPEHCNEFYICIYGNLRHDRCFDGEFFDINTYSCTKMGTDEKCRTAAEMSTLCATSEDGTNFADQTDCRKYYQCNDAELQSKKCRTGESFDTLLGFCRQSDGTCLLENGQRVGACAGKHGKLAPNVENCRGYFTCVNGQKISDECENGEYFDKAKSDCVKDVNNTCRPVEDEFTNTTQLSCVNLTELVFYPNVLDGCKTFFQCVKGTPRVHKCPDDLLFNGESGICDWKDYVTCIDMTEHHRKDEICVNASNGTRYGNTEDNCDSYYICNDGKLSNFKCDQGLKYNMEAEKCDLAANVNCTMTV